MMNSKLIGFLSLLLIFLAGCSNKETTEAPTRVLIVVGPTNHAPGTHEVAAGGRLLEYCLENMENVTGFEADVIYEWSNIPQPLDPDQNVYRNLSVITFYAFSVATWPRSRVRRGA